MEVVREIKFRLLTGVTQLNVCFSSMGGYLLFSPGRKPQLPTIPLLSPSSFLSLGDTGEDLEAYKLLTCALHSQNWP